MTLNMLSTVFRVLANELAQPLRSTTNLRSSEELESTREKVILPTIVKTED